MDKSIISALIPTASSLHREAIAAILRELPAGTLNLLAEKNCTIRPLEKRERYDVASPALKRLGIDVDAWPSPPAGLFVVEERTVYVRSRSEMTIVHELGHALDCALGDGVYRSGYDPEIRAAFTGATRFVTPYAATGVDEYFAEAFRAMMSANDASSHWPDVSPARLRKCDPMIFGIMSGIFDELSRRDRGVQMELVLR